MKKQTFKVFIEEETNDTTDFSNSDLRHFAKTVVENGFEKNCLDMFEHQAWLYRGSDELYDQMQLSGTFIQQMRKKDRVSIYGSIRTIHNLWHMEKMPSRRRAVFSSFGHLNASNFGTAVLVIPKDGTPLYGTKSDLNLSFSEQIQKWLNLPNHLGFGDISEEIYGTLITAKIELKSNYTSIADKNKKAELKSLVEDALIEFDAISSNSTDDLDASKRFFKLYDKILKEIFANRDRKLDEYTFNIDRLMRHSFSPMLVKLYDDYVAKGKSSYVAFKDFFESIKPEIFHGTKPSELKEKIDEPHDSDNTTEVWWESDTLIVPVRFMRPLYAKHVSKYIEKYKTDGFPKKPHTVKRAKAAK